MGNDFGNYKLYRSVNSSIPNLDSRVHFKLSFQIGSKQQVN